MHQEINHLFINIRKLISNKHVLIGMMETEFRRIQKSVTKPKLFPVNIDKYPKTGNIKQFLLDLCESNNLSQTEFNHFIHISSFNILIIHFNPFFVFFMFPTRIQYIAIQ